MALFTDDFNRADGAIGAAWAGNTGGWSISGNRLLAGGGQYIYPASANDTGRQDVSVVAFTQNGRQLAPTWLYLKSNSNLSNSYWVMFDDSGTNIQTRFVRLINNADTWYDAVNVAVDAAASFTFRATYDNGHLTAYINGAEANTLDDSTHAANGLYGMGVSAGGWYFDNFSGGFENAHLQISPAEVYAGNPLNSLAAELHVAEWSDVDPPSASLSVDQGWLVFQTMETTTRANFSWQSLGYIGTVTVTESEFSATGTFYSSGTPVEGGLDSWPLTEEGGGLLNATGDYCPEGRILTTCEPVDQEGTVNIPTGIDAILGQLGGYFGQVGADIGAVSLPALLYALYETPTPGTYYSVQDVLDALGGSPTSYSHADLNTNLGNVYSSLAASIADVQAAVDAIEVADLTAVLDAISALSTSLNGRLDAIEAKIDGLAFASQASVDAVAGKLDLIQPSNEVSLTSLNVNEAAIGLDVGSVLTLVGLLMGGEEMLTIQTVLDAISAIEPENAGAPVWPGLSGVTVGDAVALDDGLVIDGPLDGLLIHISAAPSRAGRFAFGTVSSWRYCGAVIFRSDRGDYEWNHPIGLDDQVIVPKAMTHADAATLRVEGGFAGTVRPFTVNPPA